MIRQVAQTISKHGLFVPGDKVGVAVSGGCDSLALLLCLVELAGPLGVELGVVHLNHGLRGEAADGDERFVAELSRELGLGFFSHRIDAAAEAMHAADNLEQTARRLRYQWFTELIERGPFAKIATGHTRSDQAETVLFRILRGSGGAGLAGIRPLIAPGIARPLLEVSREQVVTFVSGRGRTWREDATNRQIEFSRNRIRHELLPRLSRDWNPKLSVALAQLGEWARAEEEYWSGLIAGIADRDVLATPGGVTLDLESFAGRPIAVQRRLLRAAVGRVRGALTGIDYGHIEALRRLSEPRRGSGQVDLPGLRAQRSFNILRLDRPGAVRERLGEMRETINLSQPGSYSVPGTDGNIRLALSVVGKGNSGWADKKEGYNGERWRMLDWDRLPKPLILRCWQPGDRYHPWGRKRPAKLKTLFQQHRVPAWERAQWPVVIAARSNSPGSEALHVTGGARSAEAVVWAHEFGPAREYAAGPETRTVLVITASGAPSEKNLEI